MTNQNNFICIIFQFIQIVSYLLFAFLKPQNCDQELFKDSCLRRISVLSCSSFLPEICFYMGSIVEKNLFC